MKSICLLILGVLLFCLDTNAQYPESYPRKFFGVYLGPNISGFSGDYIANVEGETGKARIRTQYGVYGKFPINRDLSIFGSVQLVLNGAMTKNDNAQSATVSVSYVAKTNLTTLAIPLMATWTPKESYGLMLGPQMDLILSATEPWNRSDQVKPEDYEEDVIDKYNTLGLSLAAGGYYLFTNGTSAHLRYTHMLTDMTKEEWGNAKAWSLQLFLAINIYRD